MGFWSRKKATGRARHILVAGLEQCEALKRDIEAGIDFALLAEEHSTCPSGDRGGDLGEFRERQMVKEFNDVVFTGELNKLYGPVKTRFGYHLIEITERSK